MVTVIRKTDNFAISQYSWPLWHTIMSPAHFLYYSFCAKSWVCQGSWMYLFFRTKKERRVWSARVVLGSWKKGCEMWFETEQFGLPKGLFSHLQDPLSIFLPHAIPPFVPLQCRIPLQSSTSSSFSSVSFLFPISSFSAPPPPTPPVGTLRNIGWGCAARFPKPLPYLWPKSAIFLISHVLFLTVAPGTVGLNIIY